MARPLGVSGFTAAVAAALVGLALTSAIAAEAEAPKKVGTERIVLPTDPQASPPKTAPGPATTLPGQPTTPTAGVPAGGAPATATPQAPATTPSAATPAPAQAGAAKPAGPPPEVRKGLDGLPPAVVKMRQRLLDAAYAGDMQKLKVAMQVNEMPPVFAVNEIGDPIDYLKSQSGDGQGLEILAILSDVLESSWVRINPGTRQEMYVWPAFVALPLDKLEPGQTVELYKIVTSSDLEEMKSVGRYTFYTVGIGPDGTWHWFKPAD